MGGLASERNLTVDQFIDQWLIQSSSTHLRYFLPPKPSIPQRYGLALLNWAPPPRILRPSRYPDASYDIQQIPWWEVMRVKRPQVRALRDACYMSYHNLEYSPGVRRVSYLGQMAPPGPLTMTCLVCATTPRRRDFLSGQVHAHEAQGNHRTLSASESHVGRLTQHRGICS